MQPKEQLEKTESLPAISREDSLLWAQYKLQASAKDERARSLKEQADLVAQQVVFFQEYANNHISAIALKHGISLDTHDIKVDPQGSLYFEKKA